VSTILKALQRLEDEKSARVERSLGEQVVSHHLAPDREPSRRGLKLGIAAVGGLALVAAGFWLWPLAGDSDAVVAPEAAPVAAAPAPAPAPAKPAAAEEPRRSAAARKQPVARVRAEPTEAEAAAIVEVVKRLDEEPADPAVAAAVRRRDEPAAEPARSERRPGSRKPARRVAGPVEEPKPAAVRIAEAEPDPIQNAQPAATAESAEAEPAAPAPVEIAAVAPEPVPAPQPAPIPQPVREPEKRVIQRAKLPALSIEKTIWHPNTDRRIAIVKLDDAEEVMRLKEGDAIGPLVVESIQPGSVVFSHDGVEISYNVGG
jgi:hypothetical protein